MNAIWSGPTGPCGSQPSPRSAARRMAALDEPPTQIGGPPACTGRGRWPSPSTFHVGPSIVGNSSANAARTASIASSSSAPRWRELEPEHLELALDVAGADAEDDPAARHRVERRERLRRDERVAERQHVDVAEQTRTVRGDAGEPPERRDGVPPRGAHGVGLLGRDGDVVAHGHVPEAGLVGRPGDRRQLVGAGARLPTARRRSWLWDWIGSCMPTTRRPAGRIDCHDLTQCQIGAAVATADGLPPRPAH